MLLRPRRSVALGSLSPRSSTQNRHSILTWAAKDKRGSKNGVSSLAGLMKKKMQAEEAKNSSATPGSDQRASPAQYRDPEVRGLLFSLATSYFKATKRYLVDGVDLEQLPDALYHAAFCCLVHDRFQEGVVRDTEEANLSQCIDPHTASPCVLRAFPRPPMPHP